MAVIWTTSLLLLSQASAAATIISKRVSPAYTHSFEYPLPIPLVAQVSATYTDPSTGIPIDFYEIEVKPFEHQFYPNLGSAQLVGYNGTFPGPTFRVERGRQSLIRVVNHDQRRMNMHVHGSFTRSPWDGWALDLINPGYQKDLYLPNAVNARTLWYHDHADDHNAVNIYQGLAGMYQIFDPKEDAAVGLPSGGAYDIPLILTAHYFTPEGKLSDVSKERSSTYGDTFLVNGQIQPYLKVEPRKYRFRILNAALSRVFNLGLRNGNKSIKMTVIGSDGGLRETPVDTFSLVTGMADRWEIIIDFASFAGKNLTLITKNMWTDAQYTDSDEIMRFVVGDAVSDHTDNAPIARALKIDRGFEEGQATVHRMISFDSYHDQFWGFDGRHMDDPMKRVLFRPPLGTTERYTVFSTGMGMTKGSGLGLRPRKLLDKALHSLRSLVGRQSADSTLAPPNDTVDGKNDQDYRGGMISADEARNQPPSSIKRTWFARRAVQLAAESLRKLVGRQIANSTLAAPTKDTTGPISWGWNDTVDGMNTQEYRTGMSAAESSRDQHAESKSKRQMTGNDMMNMGGSGGPEWTHVMHLHLVDMKIVSRRKANPNLAAGRDRLEPYEEGAVKDVALLGGNEVVEVIVKYQPYPGLYMFHCHNLIHEDNGMMATFNVTKLANLNYDELTTGLEDPLDKRFAAKPIPAGQTTDLNFVGRRLLPYYASLRAYPDPATVDAIEAKYWKTHAVPSAADTGMLPAEGGVSMSMGGSQTPATAVAQSGRPSVNGPPVQGNFATKSGPESALRTGGMSGMIVGGSSQLSHHAGSGMANMMVGGSDNMKSGRLGRNGRRSSRTHGL